MNSTFLVSVPTLLRVGLNLLVVALLALAGIRAVDGGSAHPGRVLLVVVLLGGMYLAGAASPRVRASRQLATGWLLVVSVGWLVLLFTTPVGIWLAFPLFFLQLHLLPNRSGLAAVAVTTAAAIAGFGWHHHTLTTAMVIGPVLGALVAVATVRGYQALARESEQRRQLIEELSAARADLAAAERTRGALAERERLAREIHDTVAQGLSSIQLLLRAAERALPNRPETALGQVQLARRTAADNLAEARRFVHEQTPPDLESGIAAALERLCRRTTQTSGLPTQLRVSGAPQPLPHAYEVALLRIAQSAVANAVQHADARHAELTLSYLGGEVALDVVDDGRGFDPAEVAAGFGLPAMRGRARALSGTLVVESSAGEGTAVAVTLPLEQPAGIDDPRTLTG